MTIETAPPPARMPVFASAEAEADAHLAYQRVLDAWPVEFEEKYIPTSFGDTHVIMSGHPDGQPVVLLHGMFGTATAWYRNVESLGHEHRVFCVDVIGEANPSRPTRPVTSLDEFVAWFGDLLDGLEVDDVFLVGHSYGGFLSAYFAMKLPQRVTKLVLIAPASTIHSMRPFMAHVMFPVMLYQLVRKLPGSERLVDRAIDWMNADVPRDPLWTPLFDLVMKQGKLVNKVFPRLYRAKEMEEIKSPILLVFGDRERIYGDLGAAIITAKCLLPDAELAIIPDANHIAALTQPEATNEALIGFFAD